MSEMLRSSYSEPLESHLDRLAEFIMAEVDGEPSQNQCAVDTAIRIMREQAEKLRLAMAVVNADVRLENEVAYLDHRPDWRAEARLGHLKPFRAARMDALFAYTKANSS